MILAIVGGHQRGFCHTHPVSPNESRLKTETIAPDRVRLTAEEASALAVGSLKKTGYDDEQAGVIADHVMDAALCGYEYSGLPKLLNVFEHKHLRRPRRRLNAVYETPVSAMIDGGNNCGNNYGYLMMAMKPDLLTPLADYRRQLTGTLARIKATPRQPGVDEIRLPGERSFKEREQHLREGIVIDRFIYDALQAVPLGQLAPYG